VLTTVEIMKQEIAGHHRIVKRGLKQQGGRPGLSYVVERRERLHHRLPGLLLIGSGAWPDRADEADAGLAKPYNQAAQAAVVLPVLNGWPQVYSRQWLWLLQCSMTTGFRADGQAHSNPHAWRTGGRSLRSFECARSCAARAARRDAKEIW